MSLVSLPPTMRVVALAGFGAPSVLQLQSVARPEPADGECLIAVTASGVNRPDVLQRKGVYPPPPGVSEVPGLEVAGQIVAGDAVQLAAHGLQLGQRVCALVAGGGYGHFCVAPMAQCLPVPQGLSDLEAASLPENYFTVYSNVVQRGALKAGETILIHGGSSGIGVAAVQIAKALGARVIVTVRNAAKAQACLALGADAAIEYTSQDFVAQTLHLTDGLGVNVVLDMVAGEYINRDIQCVAEDGRIIVIANQGGSKATVDIGLLYRRRITLTGSTLRARPVQFKGQIAQALQEHVWPLFEQGKIQPVLYQVFAPQDAAKAHMLMESNQHIGKIVLDWSLL